MCSIDQVAGRWPEPISPEGASVPQQIVRLDLRPHRHTEGHLESAPKLKHLVERGGPQVSIDEYASKGVGQRATGHGIAGVAGLVDVADQHATHVATA